MFAPSFWEKNTFFKDIDIIIIGSGIVGLNAAITLKNIDKNLNVIVLERGFLPYGASTRNAGFACFGSVSELIDDLENTSENEVFALVERRYKGLLRLRERVGDKALDYKRYGGYEIFTASDKTLFEACSDKIVDFNKRIAHVTNKEQTYQIISDKKVKKFGFNTVENAIHNVAEGQIDTGKMMARLIQIAQQKGVKIINGITVEKLNTHQDSVEICLQNWSFFAKKVLVCTNGFAQNLLPDVAVTPARNQVIITTPIKNLSLKGCFHYDKGYVYFRNIGDRILLGGGRNLDTQTEQTDEFGTTPLIQNYLRHLLDNIILPHQNVGIEMTWSGVLGLGEVKKPIITMLNHRLGVAVRMGGMGVAIGSLVGEEGAAMIYQ
jgi:gamma-glutamylputrescine oxidase